MAAVKIGDRRYSVPGPAPVRIVVGLLLVIGGFFGFLPVLGFWMIPLGLLVLSIDLPYVRRKRRQIEVWWGRRRAGKDSERHESGR